MHIYLIYENKKFRCECDFEENKKIQVKYLFSKLPKENHLDNMKEYILVYEDEVFKKDDYIDINKYNNKEFYFIVSKIKGSIKHQQQKPQEEKKNGTSLSNQMTMAQMIKVLTNAKEEIKPANKTSNHNFQYINQHNLADSQIMLNSEYEMESEFEYEYDDLEDFYDSDVIMGNENININPIIDDSFQSSSEVDVSMNSLINGVDSNLLSLLINMGFSPELSLNALRISNNRIELAIEFLMIPIL